MTAYYNEFDPKAAAWLRELIKEGHLAPGEVDERSIEDVRPDDLRGFAQCHFFAGIGVWSYALRRAGWADDRPVWTGSCPCQPFSAAGKGGGFTDERHLWPAFHHLIRECGPDVVLGEQVAGKDGLMWFDLVQADLEATGYACGAVDTCAAGFGAPHIRQRLWWAAERVEYDARHGWIEWGAEPGQRRSVGGRGTDGVADRDDARSQGRGQPGCERAAERAVGPSGVAGGLADASGLGRDGRWSGQAGAEPGAIERPDGLRAARGMADADGWNASAERQQRGWEQRQQPQDDGSGFVGRIDRPGPVNGFWRDADWLFCRDGKWRPVEPGTFPLAHGAPARVGRLRGYGNAIVAEAAIAFIEAYSESRKNRFACP